MAVTTSFHNSGLSDVLLPRIASDLDIDVHLLVVGTGQALRLGRAGDVDAVLVHSRRAEEAFVTNSFATHRRQIMYNDFVFVGPAADPAAIAAISGATKALRAIKKTKALFVSRGDDSGTHRKELSLWRAAGLKVEQFSPDWYREVGAGMAIALNAAAGMNAYVMSDRASWLKFNNKAGLKLHYAGDPLLFNQYTFLPIDPKRHPHVKSGLTKRLENWLAGPRGQALIDAYRLDGEALFTANAKARP